MIKLTRIEMEQFLILLQYERRYHERRKDERYVDPQKRGFEAIVKRDMATARRLEKKGLVETIASETGNTFYAYIIYPIVIDLLKANAHMWNISLEYVNILAGNYEARLKSPSYWESREDAHLCEDCGNELSPFELQYGVCTQCIEKQENE